MLTRQVHNNRTDIRTNCGIIDQLDVLNSFANLSKERNMVRPTLSARYVLNFFFFLCFSIANYALVLRPRSLRADTWEWK